MFTINGTYTFNTFAPALLGAILKNAKHVLSCNYDQALKYDNVAIRYEQIFPDLPAGKAPKDPKNVIFHLFLKEDGTKVMLADPWIDKSSFQGETHKSFVASITGASIANRSAVALAMMQLGLNYTLTTVPTDGTYTSALTIDNAYTFDTNAPGLLGQTIRNAVLELTCKFKVAQTFQDVATQYSQIFDSLPTTTSPSLPALPPRQPDTVIFHRFRSEAGDAIWVAAPWIAADTLQSVSTIAFNVSVVDATEAERAQMAAALAHLGVTFTIQNL